MTADNASLTRRVQLIETAALGAGEMRLCPVQGRKAVTVYNVAGEFFVTDDTCTHGMASLAEGFLDDHVIECPWHGGAFDVRTGAPTSKPCIVALRTYPVIVEDGSVCIDLPA